MVTILITPFKAPGAPLITAHEPPSRVLVYFRRLAVDTIGIK